MSITRARRTYGSDRVHVALENEAGTGLLPELWPSIGEYSVYDAFLYYLMTNDHVRNEEFRRVLRRIVPGSYVLDIGTGQDMMWAMEAARFGARKVIAVEAMEASYAAAASRLQAAPESDLIELFNTSSFALQLSERADVCVAEMIGSIASSEGMLAVMADASKRLLEKHAIIVPRSCNTIIGAVSLRSIFAKGIAFSCDSLPYLDQVFQQYGRAFDIRLSIANLSPECILSTTEPVEILRFDDPEPLDDSSTTRLEILHPGEIDGLLCWIRLQSGSGAPVIDSLLDKTNWLPVYLPLFDAPVPVSRGDLMTVEFSRATSDDGVHPDYETRVAISTTNFIVRGSHLSAHHGTDLGSSAVHRHLISQLDSGH